MIQRYRTPIVGPLSTAISEAGLNPDNMYLRVGTTATKITDDNERRRQGFSEIQVLQRVLIGKIVDQAISRGSSPLLISPTKASWRKNVLASRLARSVVRSLEATWPAGFHNGRNWDLDACFQNVIAWTRILTYRHARESIVATNTNTFNDSSWYNPAVQRHLFNKVSQQLKVATGPGDRAALLERLLTEEWKCHACYLR